MLIKNSLSLVLALFCLSANALDISGQVLNKHEKTTASNFSNTSEQEDLAFCNKALSLSCEGGDCKTDKIIQNLIYSSCEHAVYDKIKLTEDKSLPLSSEKFIPKSYQGFDVLFSRIQDLMTITPDLNHDEYTILSEIFKKAEKDYRLMDTRNIIGYFSVAGKYLEQKQKNESETYKETFLWATKIMAERESIERKITLISDALKSPQNYIDFKYFNFNLIHNLTTPDAFNEFKGKILTHEQCKMIFRVLNEKYVSELYKHTQFECQR